MAQPQQGNLIAAAPALVVRDVRATAAWFVDRLGFACHADWDAHPMFAIVSRDGVRIALKEAGEASPPNRDVAGSGLWDAYIWVRDIEAVAAELRGRRTAVVEGPVERIYRCTELIVETPDGHQICFGHCT